MDRKPSGVVPVVIALLVVIPILYFGSFYAVLEPRPFAVGAGTDYPKYKIGGDASRVFFNPAYTVYLWLDRIWYMSEE